MALSARVILITWATMAVLYALTRDDFRRRLVYRSKRIAIAAGTDLRPDTRRTQDSTLWVFMASTIGAGLIIALGMPRIAGLLHRLSILREQDG